MLLLTATERAAGRTLSCRWFSRCGSSPRVSTCELTKRGMGAEASSSARVLRLIRQAQVVDEMLQVSLRVGIEDTERVESFVRSGAASWGLLMRTAC